MLAQKKAVVEWFNVYLKPKAAGRKKGSHGSQMYSDLISKTAVKLFEEIENYDPIYECSKVKLTTFLSHSLNLY